MALRIAVAPNEDGLGTSAWTVRLVKALARAGSETIHKIYVLVVSDRLAAFHASKYHGLPVEIVPLNEVRRPIRLVKRTGEVDVQATLESCLRGYHASREEYRRALAASGLSAAPDLFVDFGVPQLLAALRSQCAGRARTQPRPVCVTVSDHAWSDTLGRMAQAAGLLDGAMESGLEKMRADEALADCVFTFPEPLTPAAAARYWRETLGVIVQRLPGVFGGPEVARRWAGGEPRAAIRQNLGIHDDLPVLHLTGGGTAVWDDLLAGLLDDFAARPPAYHVVVFSPAERARRGVQPSWSGAIETGRDRRSPRVIYLGDVAGETHHVLFAAFDVVCTRAGGGTVGDALAFGVPLVLVEEGGHPQVEAIRKRCVEQGFARGVTLREFKRLGRSVFEKADGSLQLAARKDAEIGRYAEEDLARRLIEAARSR